MFNRRHTNLEIVHRRVVFFMMAGIAITVVIVAASFALSSKDTIKADSTGLIAKDAAVGIALNATMAERNEIQQIHADRYYVDENGHVFGVNLETMEMTSRDGDMSLTSEKLASLDRSTHFWVIGLDMGIDSGYVVVVDASTGDVKDKSAIIV